MRQIDFFITETFNNTAMWRHQVAYLNKSSLMFKSKTFVNKIHALKY